MEFRCYFYDSFIVNFVLIISDVYFQFKMYGNLATLEYVSTYIFIIKQIKLFCILRNELGLSYMNELE